MIVSGIENLVGAENIPPKINSAIFDLKRQGHQVK